ncbi:DUF724 domain-containing protein 5-like [Papaver somniferum]|uniref:DUF724 domain-containing protein 5-like n=1 Tax=Papaver somniferum TaxID=3469 RepID=UPI000E6F8DA6|nr:DUF724 domain-containing protein 5-like [Papaver somniferum]
MASSSSDVSMKLSLVPPPHRSSYLSPELKAQYDQVFEQIPQNPHFTPLSNFTDKTKEGFKLGFDLSFVWFVEKIRNSYDPSIFLGQLQSFTTQLNEFECMGYEVTKLRERLNALKELAERDALLKLQIDELEKEETEETAKAKVEEIRVEEMEKEVSRAKQKLRALKSNMFFINLKKKKLIEDAAMNLTEF